MADVRVVADAGVVADAWPFDSAQGDSLAPLVCPNTGWWVVTLSGVEGPRVSNYTRVSNYYSGSNTTLVSNYTRLTH